MKKTHAFQFKVEIKNSKPLIWRRIIVPMYFNFHDLHLAIQSLFNWANYHLYAFEICDKHGFTKNSIVDVDAFEGEILDDDLDSNKEKISNYFKKIGDKINYIYDFGDNWMHKITLEKIINDYKFDYPICTKAVKKAPCEDSGSIWGWYDKLEILKNFDSKNEEHQEIYEWMLEMIPELEDLDNPRNFDINEVDINQINEDLRDFRDMDF